MPIIKSLLDTDFYKFTMGHFVYCKHGDVPVKYALKNRTTKVRLAEIVREKDLRRELDHVRSLQFQDDELEYLENLRRKTDSVYFVSPYISFLRKLRMPPYHLETRDGQFVLEFEGPWSTTIYWETFALSIINELYYCALENVDIRDVIATGIDNLNRKIRLLSARPDIKFSDFGTRRRFIRIWQEFVIWKLKEELPDNLIGTSNVALAKRFGLKPIGTMAHELFMVYAGIYFGSDSHIRSSHYTLLWDWWLHHGEDLSIALTDTFGTDFFFREMSKPQAHNYRGLRHDSGDPIVFGEKAIKFYESHGIDPRQKVLVFSDGLEVETIIKLADYFKDRIQVSFGWGTNLTNDVGFGTLSLVVKVVEANGHGTVKLSDNLAKAMGSPEDIERFKRIFGYSITTHKECKY